jgi:hypothetical protein
LDEREEVRVNGTTDPTDAVQVCNHVLDIIGTITKNGGFELGKECRRLFRQGDADAGGPPGNLVGFDRIFEQGKTWAYVKDTIERAARNHGKLCVDMQKFADEVNKQESTEIDPMIFRWTGQLVRKICPPGSISDFTTAAGAWCTWP